MPVFCSTVECQQPLEGLGDARRLVTNRGDISAHQIRSPFLALQQEVAAGGDRRHRVADSSRHSVGQEPEAGQLLGLNELGLGGSQTVEQIAEAIQLLLTFGIELGLLQRD